MNDVTRDSGAAAARVILTRQEIADMQYAVNYPGLPGGCSLNGDRANALLDSHETLRQRVDELESRTRRKRGQRRALLLHLEPEHLAMLEGLRTARPASLLGEDHHDLILRCIRDVADRPHAKLRTSGRYGKTP